MYSLRGCILVAKADHLVAALYVSTDSSGTYTFILFTALSPKLSLPVPRDGGVDALQTTVSDAEFVKHAMFPIVVILSWNSTSFKAGLFMLPPDNVRRFAGQAIDCIFVHPEKPTP